MRQAAVGQKCPRCAKQPRRALARGKPIHYVKAIAAGAAVGVLGGFVLSFALGAARGYGGIILPSLLGFGVGRVVSWAAQRQTHDRFVAIAVVCAAAGAVIASFGPLTRMSPFAILGVVAAGYFAARAVRR